MHARRHGCRPRAALLLILIAALPGCTHVAPWERGTLASPQMALDPYPLQRSLRTHVRESREAASGGATAAGGGCGCY